MSFERNPRLEHSLVYCICSIGGLLFMSKRFEALKICKCVNGHSINCYIYAWTNIGCYLRPVRQVGPFRSDLIVRPGILDAGCRQIEKVVYHGRAVAG